MDDSSKFSKSRFQSLAAERLLYQSEIGARCNIQGFRHEKNRVLDVHRVIESI